MLLAEARTLAEQMVERLRPACDKIEIAGSVRRGKPEVKDIEIVCLPRDTGNDIGLFSDGATLADILQLLQAEKVLAFDTKVKRDGPAYKRFLLLGHDIVLELFLSTADNWGNILTIRTGNGDFSKLLMTPRAHGGCIPADLKQADGYLWRGNTRVCCPTEASYFAALGLPVVLPAERSGEKARELACALTR